MKRESFLLSVLSTSRHPPDSQSSIHTESSRIAELSLLQDGTEGKIALLDCAR